MKKVSVFVDGANMFYAQKTSKFLINWDNFLKNFIAQFGQVHEAFFYIGRQIPPVARAEKFLKSLQYYGYIIRNKEVKNIYDSSTGAAKQKANLDIEIVIDIFNTVDNYDIAVLCSGDGDFERAVELLRTRGKLIHVVSTKGYIAHELKNAVGQYYHDFTEIPDIKLRDWSEKPQF